MKQWIQKTKWQLLATKWRITGWPKSLPAQHQEELAKLASWQVADGLLGLDDLDPKVLTAHSVVWAQAKHRTIKVLSHPVQTEAGALGLIYSQPLVLNQAESWQVALPTVVEDILIEVAPWEWLEHYCQNQPKSERNLKLGQRVTSAVLKGPERVPRIAETIWPKLTPENQRKIAVKADLKSVGILARQGVLSQEVANIIWQRIKLETIKEDGRLEVHLATDALLNGWIQNGGAWSSEFFNQLGHELVDGYGARVNGRMGAMPQSFFKANQMSEPLLRKIISHPDIHVDYWINLIDFPKKMAGEVIDLIGTNQGLKYWHWSRQHHITLEDSWKIWKKQAVLLGGVMEGHAEAELRFQIWQKLWNQDAPMFWSLATEEIAASQSRLFFEVAKEFSPEQWSEVSKGTLASLLTHPDKDTRLKAGQAALKAGKKVLPESLKQGVVVCEWPDLIEMRRAEEMRKQEEERRRRRKRKRNRY